MSDKNYSPYQQKIIKRYYDNHDGIKSQRLADLVGDLYLAEGKKRERLWEQAREVLVAVGFPASRVEHILDKKDPALLAGAVKELEGKGQ